MQFQKLLVTGGAGFIGSNFIRHVLKNYPQISIINLDKLTYAGNLRSLVDVASEFAGRYRFVKGDILDKPLCESLMAGCDAVVHFAAESHVDRSVVSAEPFVTTNVQGTLNLLECARQLSIGRFLHVSTDEVYGELGDSGAFTEETPLAPNSPYSASKAASDFLVRAFVHTHKLNAVITRCSNNYGPYHFPEKLIPLMITNALENKPLPVYGTGENVRDWIYVEDHCAGVFSALQKGLSGEVYNLGGRSERKNIDVVRSILKILNKDDSLIRMVEDRKGHDWRYAIDCSKAETELNWAPTVVFEEGLEKTIKWYIENSIWWKEVKSGEHQRFYESYYKGL